MRAKSQLVLIILVAADALAASPARLVNPLQHGPFAASSDVETFVAMPGAGKLPAEWEQLWRSGAAAHARNAPCTAARHDRTYGATRNMT